MVRCLNEGVRHTLEFGDTTMACQYLGMLGVHHQSRRELDRSVECWQRGLELARADGNWHEARFLGIFANRAMRGGEISRAMSLILEAEACCRRLGDDQPEVQFLHRRLLMLGDMGCWGLVEKGLARADVLLRNNSRNWPPEAREIHSGMLQAVRMRLLAAQRRFPEAELAAEDLMRSLDTIRESQDQLYAKYYIARTWVALGQLEQAATLLDSVNARADRGWQQNVISVSLLERADLALSAGDTALCRRLLDYYPKRIDADTTGSNKWIRFDALRCRLALEADGRSAAASRLTAGLARFAARRPRMGNDPEAVLSRHHVEQFRDLFHKINAGSPESGYAFEMAWRDFLFPGWNEAATLGPVHLSALAETSRPVSLAPLPEGMLHCVYRVEGSSLVRWARDSDGVVREVVSRDVGGIAERIGRVRRWLADPGRPEPDPALAHDLRELAGQLLPAESPGKSARRLLVTRERCLSDLPFEALNVAGTGYRPLLLDRDVAYVNSLATANDGAGSSRVPARYAAVVLAGPGYSPEATRRWSILTEPLRHGLMEAKAAAAGWPGSLLLIGRDATRERLQAAWESAERLYLTSHVVHDPDREYVDLLPLADGEGDADALGMADILDADLSRCRLVVLSGCATGVRFRTDRTDLPSLGDAVVHAGAAAAVVTGWNVRDADGAELMRGFAAMHGEGAIDPVSALGEARRELLRRGVDSGVWAAYAIIVRVPTEPAPIGRGMGSAWNQAN
jgi:CHAT domain-containing protein